MLQHYGDSIRWGHKHILQSLPRLLTLYFEFGNKVATVEAAAKQGQAQPKPLQQTLKNAQLQVIIGYCCAACYLIAWQAQHQSSSQARLSADS
jgi:hypothetical protein